MRPRGAAAAWLTASLVSAALAACNGGDASGGSDGTPAAPETASPFVDRQAADCVLESPYREVGADLDAPSRRLSVPVPEVGAARGACRGNRGFRFGSGIRDITGPAANTSGMGWESPTQVLSGIHLRQFARAFAFESPCNGKRVLFVSTDTGMVFGAMRLGVLDAIADDPELAAHYGPDNLMLSATHTHNGPAGYSHYEAFNLLHFGFDRLVLETIVDGIVAAIRAAHANLEAHPETAPVGLAVGELLNTNINRSLTAFENNPEAERKRFVDARGEPVTVNKRVVQLNLVRERGGAVGMINWFGVHPTVMGPETTLVSSDNKGYASLGFERIMATEYGADAADGADNFVAAFAQADAGDASPNIFIRERPHPDPTRGGGANPRESTAISGTKQLAKALRLYRDGGEPLTGPVDYRLFHVRMDRVTVTDPAVLASLNHPPELDAESKRTCGAAMGISFAAGAEDGPGFTTEGLDCGASPRLLQSAAADVAALFEGKLPGNLLSDLVLCQVDSVPLLNLSCHAEKPVLLPVGPPLNAEPPVLPFQLLRLGNLAILGIPWEVTTVASRRIQTSLLEILAPVGIDTLVVAGLANNYAHYLTTRSEYALQQYEGASNIYGPWTLAAVRQEARRLARTLADGAPAPAGPEYVDSTPVLRRTPHLPTDLPGPGRAFGDVVTQPAATAAPGDTVSAEFQSGHPRNDLKRDGGYVFAERRTGDEQWTVVAADRDPELIFEWRPAIPSPLPIELPAIGPSTAAAIWHIPADTPPGIYRLRHEGAARTAVAQPVQYSGASRPFAVEGAAAACP